MSMSIDQEEKIISSLAQLGVIFPVSITYPNGKVTYVARMKVVKDVIVKPKRNNIIIFPTNLESA